MDGHHKFYEAAGIERWAVLVKDGQMQTSASDTMAQLLINAARSAGIAMAPVCDIYVSSRHQTEDAIEKELTYLKNRFDGLQIVVVILPGGGPWSKDAYGKLMPDVTFF